MKYFKNENENLFFEPSEAVIEKHNLKKITKKEFDKILEIQNTPSEQELKDARVAELKAMLANSDFKMVADYDKPNDDIKTQRQAWREEIRELEE